MTETLTKPFIIVLTFVSATAILLTLSQAWMIGATSSPTDEGPESWETIGAFDITWWLNETDSTDGYVVHTDSTQVNDLKHILVQFYTNWLTLNYDDEEDFWRFHSPYDNSLPDIRLWIIRNNPDYVEGSINWWETASDFFLLTKETQDWPFPNVRKAVIPFDEIYDATIENNSTYVQCQLGQLSNVTLYLNSTTNLTTAVMNNDNYTVRIGTPWDADLASTSMWTVLGQLLTLQLPDTHWAIDWLIAIPLWAGIGFIAITLVSRFIPLVSGG